MSAFTPTRRGNPCGICSDTSGDCRETNQGGYLCHTHTDDSPQVPGFVFKGLSNGGVWGIWGIDTGNFSQIEREQWQQQQQLIQQQRASQEKKRRASAMPSDERDRNYKKLIAQLSLAPVDRADLNRRGLSNAEIKQHGYVSAEQWQRLDFELPHALPGVSLSGRSLNIGAAGYLCPIRNVDGEIVAYQSRRRADGEGGRYRWASSKTKKRPNGATAHLKSGELPLSVFCAESFTLGFAEGTGPKPHIASLRLGINVIGAAGGDWIGGLQQLKQTIETLKPESFILYPDAGAVDNRGVMLQYEKLNDALADLGHVLQVGWWGQSLKNDADIDELTAEQLASIRVIDWAEFEAMGKAPAFRGALGIVAKLDAQPKKKTAKELAETAAYFRSKNPGFYGLTCDRTVINQRYITLDLPASGSLLAVSSDVSTGKTETLKRVKQQFFERHPDGYFDEQGYRNGLLRQKVERNGGDHIRDLECSDAKWSQGAIDESHQLHYCLDSLNRRAPALQEAIANGRKVLINLDEADAIVKHLVGGGTLGIRQAEIWLMWCDLLKAVIAGGGYVVALEADLSQIAVDAIAEAAGNPSIVAIENTYRPHVGREVVNHIQLNKEGLPSDNLLSDRCESDVINAALRGKKVFLATDTQKLGEKVEVSAIKLGLKVLRVDRDTGDRAETQNFLASPNAELPQHQYDIVTITTTAESGLSIDGGYFDTVALFGCHLENRALKQLGARVRGAVPLHTYIRNRAIAVGEDPDSFTPEGVLKAHEKNKQDSAIAAGVALHFDTEVLMSAGAALTTPEAVNLHKWQATFAARKNLSGAFLRANTLHLFKATGHVITEHSSQGFTNQESDRLVKSKEAVIDRRAEVYTKAPLDKSVSWAVQKLSASGCTYLESVEAQKILDNDAWPGLPFNDLEFVKTEVVKKRKQRLKAHTFGWLCDHPKIAKIIDLKSWKSQLEQPFIIASAIRRESAKTKVLAQSALNEIAQLESYTESHPTVAKVAAWAKERAETLGRLFRLQIKPDHTNIATVNKLLRKIGYVSIKAKRGGSDGDRTQEYKASPMPCQAEVYAALNRKWADELSSETIEVEAPRLSTSPIRSMDTLIRVGDVKPKSAIEQRIREPIPIPATDTIVVPDPEADLEGYMQAIEYLDTHPNAVPVAA